MVDLEHILLIGPRGAGKSAVGRELASILRRRLIDLDDVVRRGFNEPTISEIWRRRGEGAWRAAEESALRAVFEQVGLVVALGGGTPMIESARRLIDRRRTAGGVVVIYLQCPADELVRRLRTSPGDRPGLTGSDPIAEIPAVLAQREPTYLALADHVVDATAGPAEVAERIREML